VVDIRKGNFCFSNRELDVSYCMSLASAAGKINVMEV
jgi:hypothetical protein